MIDLPFTSANGSGLLVPSVSLDITSQIESGGLGGLADAASSLLGGSDGQRDWVECLVSLRAHLCMAPGVDNVELVIGQTRHTPTAAVGDQVSLGLGMNDSPQALFKGRVIGVEQRVDGTRRYRLGNASQLLASLRVNQSMTDMSVAEIIENLAQQAGTSLQKRITGADDKLRQTVIMDAWNGWQHMAEQARLRGFSLWVDEHDKVQLANQLEQQTPVHTYTLGEDVIQMSLWDRADHSGAITVTGGARDDSGYVLRKQPAPNQASGGDGLPQRFYRHGNLTAPGDLASAHMAASLAAHRATTTSTLTVPGVPGLRPGAVITLAGLPDGQQSLLILAATHQFTHLRGWQVELTVSDAGNLPDAGALLGALGGLL